MRRFKDYKMIIILSVYIMIIYLINFLLLSKYNLLISNLSDLEELLFFRTAFVSTAKVLYILVPLLSAIIIDIAFYAAFKKEYIDIEKSYIYFMLIIPAIIYILFAFNYDGLSRILVGAVMLNTVIISSIMIFVGKRKMLYD